MDTITPEERSRIMGRVRGKDTSPEWRVRRFLYSRGFRYLLHVPDLPGKPDIVLSKRRKVIFVHGCFWHLHAGCKLTRLPKSRVDFWTRKLEGNAARDAENEARLRAQGWDVLVLWECQTEKPDTLSALINDFLG
jgi:DNA mismatch endonuclease, patch repair protein